MKYFDGGYNRKGKIWADKGICMNCDKEKIVIFTDSSEKEYNPARICPECVKKMCKSIRKEIKMDNCVPEKWGVKVKPGDKISFEMPPFCSGDYTFEVIKKNGVIVLENDAPEYIFDGCRGYHIIRKKNQK
jgi:uncharacterized protein CbrC (UPF0167 family)